MVYGGISITKLTMIQTTASLQVPMGYIYMIVPVTGILIMFFSFTNAMDMLLSLIHIYTCRRTGWILHFWILKWEN